MSEPLRVRVYNVGFGDAILVTIPEKLRTRTTVRHLLIDVGNALSGEGGNDALFKPAIEDILSVLDGDEVDLYVMTHEHLDHVQGLKFAADKLSLEVPVKQVWLTGSAEPGYYDTHPDAKKRRLQAQQAYLQIHRFLAASEEHSNPLIETMLLNNNVLLAGDGAPGLEATGNPRSTADCVDHLRTMGKEPPVYVHRELDLDEANPFREAKLRVLAPEEDTSSYYGRFQPMALGDSGDGEQPAGQAAIEPEPPPGIDAGAFYDLVGSRRGGFIDNLLAIDAANNNTSVVLQLEWRGWKLLFPGDAEVRSWKTMAKFAMLEPVHLLKVGHHGSHNGTPAEELLDLVFPEDRPDEGIRRAVVSTVPEAYPGVPHGDTIDRIRERCDELLTTEDVPPGMPVVLEFAAEGPEG